MKKLYVLCLLLLGLPALAQHVAVKWELSNPSALSSSTMEGEQSAADLLSPAYAQSWCIANTTVLASSNAETGLKSVTYSPHFTQFYVTTKTTAKTQGHNIAFGVKAQAGHTFKPTHISFDAAKCGTDGGNVDVVVKTSSTAEKDLAVGVSPLRNKITETNTTGYSHYEYDINDYIVSDENFLLYLYIYNINGTDTSTPKGIAFRNVIIEGEVDEPLFTAEHYVTALSCKGPDGNIDLASILTGVKNGATVNYPTKLSAAPSDFVVTAAESYNASVQFVEKDAKVTISNAEGKSIFSFTVHFVISNVQPKPAAKALNRGLMSANLSSSGGTGNLISWRMRAGEEGKVKYKLYRGTNAEKVNANVNNGKFITSKTNYRDPSGTTSMYYKLEVYDLEDNLLETEVSGKTWSNQSMEIPTSTPIDNVNGAVYTPNDASFCDMDGDGEYEIILKWAPSNEKDAASNGTTSNPIFDCYKLDGTQLWRIDLGPNFFNSAHTIQFIAWDFDGDGYGEFMCKTAPGTIDGQGNYVLLGSDDPKENLLSGRGKQDHGSEYITVFDGMTGAELSTIPYHTDYAAGEAYWGDSKQNRSERYLAALAYLDGPDKNPSPIFARGYYSGAFVGAYDFDGVQLKERWVSRNTASGKGLWGEGAHWISVGDVDGDEKQEIVYGAACLDHDGSLLYRTGLKHGDALHLGDFLPEREGMEVFMAHESSPYGVDLRDAKTGQLLLHPTASGDTGRGLAAHFDASSNSAQFIYSASAGMFSCADGSQIASTWAIGQSGAGINARVYWNGDLLDEFFDKSIIAHWNHESKSFDRIQYNGGNYLWGSLNNSTKNNPCVLGDLLGDWREEIVTWNSETNALIINSTNFESDYKLPHLMEDLNYRAQVVNQNCCYNQPPHLSYDPLAKLTLRYEIPASGWLPLYTSYPVSVSEGDVTLHYVNAFDTTADTLKMKSINGTIPGGTGFLVHGKPGTVFKLRPSVEAASSVTLNKMSGDCIPTTLVSTETASFYRWDSRPEIGTGYFRVEADTCPAGEAYVKIVTASARDAEYYLVGETAVGVSTIKVDASSQGDNEYYTLDGKKLGDKPSRGIVVKKGKKQVVK